MFKNSKIHSFFCVIPWTFKCKLESSLSVHLLAYFALFGVILL